MPASIMQVARELGRLSGWSLSNLEMQKIGFVAEMLHLGRADAPLIREQWQAWSYGPVQPDLYHKAKIFGANNVKDIFVTSAPLAPSQRKAVVDAYEMMKDFSPGQMIDVTHQSNGAWAGSYNTGLRNATILKSAIKSEYSTLITEDDD